MSDGAIIIEIDGKAVAKGRGRIAVIAGKGRIFTPAHTRSYEQLIRMLAMQEMKGREPIAGAVMVKIIVNLPVPDSMSAKKKEQALAGNLRPTTKPDIDNYVKSALDGINTIVIVDDNQVVSLEAFKYYRAKPSMIIYVLPIEEELAL